MGYLIKFINYIIYFKYVVKTNPTRWVGLEWVSFGELVGQIDWIFEYSQPAKKGVGYKSTK